MSEIAIPAESLRALFDIAVGSLDFGSGFLDSQEVEHLRAVAVLLGIDPIEATPPEFKSQYPHGVAWDGTGCSVTRCAKGANDPIHQPPAVDPGATYTTHLETT
jgi:hypothetical protein